MSELLAVALSLLAALLIAGQAMCVRLGTQRGTANDALMVALFMNVAVFVPLGVVRYAGGAQLTAGSFGAFVGAGLIATLVGRSFFFEGISRIGSSRSEPIKAAQPLFASILAVFLLGERLAPTRFLGISLVVGGVGIVSWEVARSESPDPTDRPLVGLLFPLVAALMYGVEPLFAKTGFAAGTPPLLGLAIKTTAATLGFLIYLRLTGQGAALGEKQNLLSRWNLAAGVANTAALLSYYTALTIAPVTLVTPLIQMSPVFVVILSYLLLQRIEQVTWQLAAAAGVVVAGAVLVTVGG